jgi:SAM-dependent methyltransferase
MAVDQSQIFRDGEGDAWFRRNAKALSVDHREDQVLAAIERLHRTGERPQSICELGCANGWRLAAIAERYPEIGRLAGCDVSEAAIADGSHRWPTLDLAVGPIEQPPIQGLFDVVIVSYVLHWVARSHLSRAIAAIDTLVNDGGILIVSDFLPDRPVARRYHHRGDVKLYTYKQDYGATFIALGYYERVDNLIFSHSGVEGEIDPQDRAQCSALRKSFATYEAA